jgi:peptide/nickel transport system substrate-binding protein
MALSLLAAACGGGDDDDGATGQTDDGGEAAEEGDPKPGGILRMAVASDIDSLDPMKLSSFNTHQRVGIVYNKLLGFETGPDVDYTEKNLVPELAEEWEVSDDGLTYTFRLRDDVTWHNVAPTNGRPFVADDVIATFDRVRELGFQRYMLENVTSWDAPDDHTVVLTLSQPFAPLLNFMANHQMWIIPREAQQGQIDLSQTAVGTGPFVMTRRERNVETAYEKNPNYWEDGKPYLDGVTMLVVPDATSKVNAFRAGEIDLSTTTLSPEEVTLLERSTPDAAFDREIDSGLEQLYVNLEREPFDDLRVRQAINYAIDKEAMGEQVFGGGDYTAIVPPAMGDWSIPLEEKKEYQPYDPERARELLAEAGFPNGFDTTLMLTTGYGENVVRMGEWVVEDLAQVGIRARIELIEYATYFGSRWPNGDYDMGIGPQTPFLEADEWLRAQLHSEGTRNWFNINDPELDEMLVRQTQILDEDERKEYVHEVQRYWFENVLNPIPVWSPSGVTPEQEWVKGWNPIAMYGYPWIKDVWLDR